MELDKSSKANIDTTRLTPPPLKHPSKHPEDEAWEQLNRSVKLTVTIVSTCAVAWVIFAALLIFERFN